MGLLNTILGRTKPVAANLDALFALPSAAVTLETAEGLVSSGRAGVCWKAPAGRAPADLEAEISQLLQLDDQEWPLGGSLGAGGDDLGTGQGVAEAESAEPQETGAGDAAAPPTAAPPTAAPPTKRAASSVGELTRVEDSFGYQWLLLQDPSLEDLVTRVHLVNSTLTDNGWGPQLLCSVFPFVPGPEAGSDAKSCDLIYLYKRGTFYPFAPIGHEQRDTALELHLRSVLGSDLPVEVDVSRWFPLWDIPVH